MANLLHISANEYPPLNQEHSTKKIWRELALGFDEYHIIGRAKDNKFHNYKEGNIYLHLVPNLYRAPSFFFTSFYILNVLKKHKIDIMLAQCPILGGFTSNLLSKKFNIPVFQEFHDTFYFDLFRSKKLVDKILASITLFSIKKSSKVRALNRKMEEMILDISDSANTVIIENRVDINKFKNNNKKLELGDPISVTSIGTFVYRKGYHTAIEAIKNLSKNYNISLTLVGGGKDKDKLVDLAKDHSNIKLIDRLPQEELVQILKNTDIYIQPSIREGMPRTILEAMAMQLPVIATNVSTIPGTVIDNVNGLIINPEDVKQLENAIIKLINDDELRNRIANQAYKDVKSNHEWNSAFKLYRNEILKTKI